MVWWMWVVIAIAVGMIGYLKLTVWRSMAKKKPSKQVKDED
jgi:hypothetical protein